MEVTVVTVDMEIMEARETMVAMGTKMKVKTITASLTLW
jgi:hypothetical protein